MNLKAIVFNANNGPVTVQLDFKGLIGLSYTFTLWEANSNQTVMQVSGNNLNSADDQYELPSPANMNNNRLIDLLSSFTGMGLNSSTPYTISIAVIQQGNTIDTYSISGSVDYEQTRQVQMYVKLVSQ